MFCWQLRLFLITYHNIVYYNYILISLGTASSQTSSDEIFKHKTEELLEVLDKRLDLYKKEETALKVSRRTLVITTASP